MHATTEQLLNLRDGRPVDALVAAHVGDCKDCRRALHGLERMRERLRALHAEAPPRGAWAEVLAEVGSAPASTRARRHHWPLWVGTAAGFVLGMALILNMTQREATGPVPGTTTDLVAATPAPASSVNGVSTAELRETSRQLEATLRAIPAAPQLMRASTVLTIEELQDRLFEVDLLLGQPGLGQAEERALWQQRVRLMDTLMQVRLAQFAETY